MAKRAVVNGKVMPTPNLGSYDSRKFRTSDLHMPNQVAPDFKAALAFDKDYPSTRTRDKALLVALGVDGDVPLAQARVNAGLDRPDREFFVQPDAGLGEPQKKFSETFSGVAMIIDHFFPANDNHEQAAVAA